MFPLETDRLLLRPFRDSDLETFVAYRSDSEVARYQGWQAPYRFEKGIEFIAGLKMSQPGRPGEWYQLALELKGQQRMIGDCGFCISTEDSQQAEIGFTLARAFQGQGYATEAVTCLLGYLFDGLQLHRVHANCDVENINSARLLERVGMRREGHSIQSLWFKGRWSSEYWYAILQAEWSAKNK